MTYVVINLLASTLFVAAIACVYAATGTVNMADLATAMDGVPDSVRTALSLLFVVVFGIKAAIFPLFFWLPDSYPAAQLPVTAVFAGLLTKVGVYALIRTQTLLFPADGPSTVLLVIAGLTMVVGVLGAIAQNDMKRILSFHIVSQIGYMMLGLGAVHRCRCRRRDPLHRPPDPGEDGAVPRARARRGIRRFDRAPPRRRTHPANAGCRGPVPGRGAEPRRHPAAVGLRRQARPHRGRLRPRARTRSSPSASSSAS